MGIVIPFEQLQAATLDALIEEFVTRDGAVHGHADVSLERQVEAVRRQLTSGRAVIVFDEEDETCTIMSTEERAGGRKLRGTVSDEEAS